jgi:hypothetical protein
MLLEEGIRWYVTEERLLKIVNMDYTYKDSYSVLNDDAVYV